ncbi:MAG: L-erythro-3,5-diaminohexanoate dehydrogenase [Peptococcaceae bacterium]|nr:L-erythro-3,5-diaminohexanoate dehydrogenase [Peptococcaceae bacterium]
MKKGCPYGTHRVLEPPGVLPQLAWKLDNRMEIYANEILLEVEALNIDSASFAQIKSAAGGDTDKIAQIIMETVSTRGKQHNPVTGSGGMLIGTVAKIGPAWPSGKDLQIGDKIASLVSLSLTPLKLTDIKAVHLACERIEVLGQAILFASGIYAKLPADIPVNLALAVLDVAGAPAQTARLVQSGDCVAVFGGGGKSGLLCLYEAKKRAGVTGVVIGLGRSEAACVRMERLGVCDHILQLDVRQALNVYAKIAEVTAGRLVDVAINCVNSPGTEMATILATKESGTAYFFSMATSFTAATLGAEGVGKDVKLVMGNGYCRDHAVIALHLLRESPELNDLFSELYMG